MKNIITAKKLNKKYQLDNGTIIEAVKEVNFSVAKGECVGLLGANGAGKTTTMRMLMGLTEATAGELTIFDKPISELSFEEKSKIGLVPQEDNLDLDLTIRQNLETYGRYFSLKVEAISERVESLLDFMQLSEKVDAKVRQLSGGMRRRLIIARALIANPELIILDEPTTGLDPQARVLIWKRMVELKSAGKTLLLTTHYMDEAQRLCDRIVIIDKGKVLDVGTPQELIDKYVKPHVFEFIADEVGNHKAIKSWVSGASDRQDIGNSIFCYVDKVGDLHKIIPEDMRYIQRRANLEDVFLKLTGHGLGE